MKLLKHTIFKQSMILTILLSIVQIRGEQITLESVTRMTDNKKVIFTLSFVKSTTIQTQYANIKITRPNTNGPFNYSY